MLVCLYAREYVYVVGRGIETEKKREKMKTCVTVLSRGRSNIRRQKRHLSTVHSANIRRSYCCAESMSSSFDEKDKMLTFVLVEERKLLITDFTTSADNSSCRVTCTKCSQCRGDYSDGQAMNLVSACLSLHQTSHLCHDRMLGIVRGIHLLVGGKVGRVGCLCQLCSSQQLSSLVASS